jgi:predicted ATPase/class 3 adenylate cyclase
LPNIFRFCNKCGTAVSKIGALSATILPLDEKLKKIRRFLPKGLTEKILSQRDKIEGERKLVTVLFCDMQGFTPLSEQLGSEKVYALMNRVYEILIQKVHDYDGTVNEFTGDGIMALFGAPIAIEDAPQRAIRSAHAIHVEISKLNEELRQGTDRIPPIRMRIGIHTGSVVVGTLGNDLRVEFKAVGDTVNLASRMEGLAESGSTYVSEATFRLTEGYFLYEALGNFKIKGKSAPVKAFRVIGPKNRRTRFDVSAGSGLTSFIGRERELELLIDGFKRAKDGRGQAFSIVSEAGVGKSRLLYEFRKAIASDDVTFLEGKCLSYSQGVPYHLHIDTLKANFDIRDDDRETTIRKKVRKGLSILNVDEDATLPFFLELLSVKVSELDLTAISPEIKKDRILNALKRIVLKGSEIRPLVLAYEDLHWIDSSSFDYLKYLLEIIPGARILLIFTYRPDFKNNFGAKSYHSQIVLNRLSNRESLTMVHQMLGAFALDSKLEEYILKKTDGVPFFIEELIKSFRETKIIEEIDGTYCIVNDMEKISVPASVQDVIMVRIDALPETGKRLLQTAAVIGREFNHDIIKHVADLSQDQLLSTLSLLKETEHLYERGIYPHSTYIFKHALTQEMAYNSLLSKRKKSIHKKIGKSIEQLKSDNIEEHYEILVYHYSRSDDHASTLKYLDLANQKAARLCAMNEAKLYFDESMRLLDDLDESDENRFQRISLLARQGTVIELLLKFQEYYDLLVRYEPLAKEIDNPKLIGAYYVQLGQCHFAFGHYDNALKTLSQAVALCVSVGDTENAAHAYAYLILAHLDQGNYEEALKLKDDLVRMNEQRSNIRWYVRGVSAVGNAYSFLGKWRHAIQEGKSALNVAMQTNDDSLVSLAASNLTLSYCFQGDTDAALYYGRLAVKNAKTPGDTSRSKRSLGWALCRSGQTEMGIKYLEDAVLPMFQSGGFKAFEIPLQCFLGDGYWMGGDHQKALKVLKKGLAMAEKSNGRFFIGFASRIMAQMYTKNDPLQSESLFKRSIGIFKELKAENEMAMAMIGYGWLCKSQNNDSLAHDIFQQALEIFNRLGTKFDENEIKKAVGPLLDTFNE